MSVKSSSKGKRSSLQWTETMDQILVDALLHQVVKGNRVNGQFTTIAFEEVVEEVCNKTQMDSIDKDKVKNRIKTLKRSFAEASDFALGLTGILWNPITKLFEADNQLWNDLIKSNPNAVQWKTRPISQYNKLKEIWGKDDNVETTKAKAENWSTPMKIKGEIVIDNINEKTTTNFDFVPSRIVSSGSSSKSRGVNATKKRKIEEDALIVEMKKMKNVMDHLVDVLATGNSVLERSRPRVYSESEVYAELERMKLDDDVRLEAYEFLTANQAVARNMFGLPLRIGKIGCLGNFMVQIEIVFTCFEVENIDFFSL